MTEQKVSPGFLLHRLISQGVVVAPGAFMPIVARQIEMEEKRNSHKPFFSAVYVSGGALHQSRAFPDEGILTREKVAGMASEIISATRLPCIVDVDTGFDEDSGGVGETVRIFENIGAAAIQIEDQVPGFKRCGHLEGKRLIPLCEMTDKISRTVRARNDPNFIIIARTDARAVEGFNGAVLRAEAYLAAGADVIFPEALKSKEEFRKFRDEFPVSDPFLANMTEDGKTPYITVKEFGELGYNIVIFPMTGFRAALQATKIALSQLRQYGTQKGLRKKNYLMSRKQVAKLLLKINPATAE
ncbi:MAG: isocitrate lyase/phosphoenolpyruvate mutase family protein [Patescibacteria group bacterium]